MKPLKRTPGEDRETELAYEKIREKIHENDRMPKLHNISKKKKHDIERRESHFFSKRVMDIINSIDVNK